MQYVIRGECHLLPITVNKSMIGTPRQTELGAVILQHYMVGSQTLLIRIDPGWNW